MLYRLAQESDIDAICRLIQAAVSRMEERQIFQWDGVYPTKEDFMEDIQRQQHYIGLLDENGNIRIVITASFIVCA